MEPVAGLAAAATIISTAFALCTLERYVEHRKVHELAWTQSLTMFAIASAAYWWGAATGWSSASFRVFYLFGAILNVAYLAAGTVALLGGAELGRRVLSALHLVAAFCAGVMLIAPLRLAIPARGLPSGREIFGLAPRIMAAVGSAVGATVVVVGALVSVWRLLRSRRAAARSFAPVTFPAGRLAATNALIAAGTLVLGVGGAAYTGEDAMVAFGVFLVIGVAILFGGFLLSSPRTARRDSKPALTPFLAELWDIAHGLSGDET